MSSASKLHKRSPRKPKTKAPRRSGTPNQEGAPLQEIAPVRADQPDGIVSEDGVTARALATELTKTELTEVLALFDACLACTREEDLARLLLEYSRFLGFEFLLYTYMQSRYLRSAPVHFVNVSNPKKWMAEYHKKNYVESDPIRVELELRLAGTEQQGVILWDAYERKVSAIEQHIIDRRTSYGLRYGFSAFCNSPRHESVFLVSFASATTKPDERAMALGRLVVPHLNRCRKRLDLLTRVNELTKRERCVARWLIEGKTNWEIAQMIEVSESTVKYHVANILTKLQTNSRQSAVAILIAERFLS